MTISRVWGLGFVLAIAGCAQEPAEHEMGDAHGLDLEGPALVEVLDGEGVSPVYTTDTPFVRLALMWDAAPDAALEIRTGHDGSTWSEWRAPDAFFAEDGAFAGKLDTPEIASVYQFRVAPGAAGPTRLVIQPIAEMPLEASLTQDPSLLDLDIDAIDEADLAAIPARSVDATGDVAGVRSAISDADLRIRSRAEWGARPPRCRSATSPTRATIHHTVTSNSPSSVPRELRRIQSFHMDGHGWCDIGYNFVVSRGGGVWRARGARTLGAHTDGANTGNVGIAFLGTYTSSGAPSAMRTGAAKLLKRLHRLYPISLDRRDVKGHRQFGSTACPGNALYGQLDGLVRLAR